MVVLESTTTSCNEPFIDTPAAEKELNLSCDTRNWPSTGEPVLPLGRSMEVTIPRGPLGIQINPLHVDPNDGGVPRD